MSNVFASIWGAVMSDPDSIIPKLLELKHQNQVRRLSAVMTELRLIECKQKALSDERAKLDQDGDGFVRISVQNGYERYLQARDDVLTERAMALRAQVAVIQKSLKETMCSQEILRDHPAV